MHMPQEILAWITHERQRIARNIDLIASGQLQLSQRRGGRMLDVTGDALKDLRRRETELDHLVRGPGEPSQER